MRSSGVGMTDEAWQSLYKTVVDNKIRTIDGHMVARGDAAEVLVYYDHPANTREVRRCMRRLSFGELQRLARDWLRQAGARPLVDPEGFA